MIVGPREAVKEVRNLFKSLSQDIPDQTGRYYLGGELDYQAVRYLS